MAHSWVQFSVGMSSRLRKAYVAAKFYELAYRRPGRAIAKRRRPAHPPLVRNSCFSRSLGRADLVLSVETIEGLDL
jgi:hypothetical protein